MPKPASQGCGRGGIRFALAERAVRGASPETAMPIDLENPSAHEPALSRDHAAGVQGETQSPAERALAPEADAPMQSANASADDGTYVGQGGGYMGASTPAVESGEARVDQADVRGEGAYGYPAGPGVGMPGGEHQPAAQPPSVDSAPMPKR
jgi:hypothetical protein